MEHFSVV